MENLSEDESKQVEMLEKLDFFKRDHHLSSGGTLKPDERKQWQIFCKVCIFYRLSNVFRVFLAKVLYNLQYFMDGRWNSRCYRFRSHCCAELNNNLFVCLHNRQKSSRFVLCLGCCCYFPLICCVVRFRRAELYTQCKSHACKPACFHCGSGSVVKSEKHVFTNQTEEERENVCERAAGRGVKCCNKYRYKVFFQRQWARRRRGRDIPELVQYSPVISCHFWDSRVIFVPHGCRSPSWNVSRPSGPPALLLSHFVSLYLQ